MERKEPEFGRYLEDIVQRDRRGYQPTDQLGFPLNSGRRKSSTKSREAWPIHQQRQQLAVLLGWRYGRLRGKCLADELIREFDTLPAVFAASDFRLCGVPGVTDGCVEGLRLIQEIAERMALVRLQNNKPILSSRSCLLEYLQVKTGHSDVEQFRVLFLDKKNRLIRDELQTVGTVDHVPVYPREVVRRALELCACALILVHNHPSGDPSPSAADVQMTKEIRDVAQGMGIVLHDHIIISRMGHTSMRGLNLF